MSNNSISVYSKALQRQKEEKKTNAKSKPTLNITRKRDNVRDMSRNASSDLPRDNSRDLPTRDEIQEFSFRLRDELRVKVQAEVPHQWQKELDEISRKQGVKKLELYRYIFGEFLGKIPRK